MGNLTITIISTLLLIFMGIFIKKDSMIEKLTGDSKDKVKVIKAFNYVGNSFVLLGLLTIGFKLLMMLYPVISGSVFIMIVVFWFVIVTVETQLIIKE